MTEEQQKEALRLLKMVYDHGEAAKEHEEIRVLLTELNIKLLEA